MKLVLSVVGVMLVLLMPNAFAIWPFDSTPSDSGIITTRQKDSIISYDQKTNQASWQSAPQWVLDYTDWQGNPVYKPYQIWDSSTYITFENAQASVTIEKKTCSLKIFDGGKVGATDNPILNSISFNLQSAKNGTDDWNETVENFQTCNVSWITSGNGLTANMKQGSTTEKNIELRLYDNQIPELVLKVKNNDLTNSNTKYGYAITISNPLATVIDGDLIKFLDDKGQVILIFDTQNTVNHYLWTVKKTNSSIILDYKNATGPLLPLQTLEIDPTFTANPSPNIYNMITSGTVTCGSYSSTSTSGTLMNAYELFGGDNGCGNSAAEFDISSFPKSAVVSSVQLKGTLTSSAAQNCAFVQDLDRPSTTSGATLYSYIGGSTAYVTQSCNPGSTKINLGSTALTDLKNQYSLGWFGVGLRYAGDGITDSTFSLTPTQLLINYTLPVPSSVTGLSCTPNQALGITCSWNNST